MRTLGDYLVSVSDWELKKKLPVHLFGRIRCVPIRSANDRELVEAVYYVIKNALCDAYERYLAESDPLDDAPTFFFYETVCC